jgi:hypothetical protein
MVGNPSRVQHHKFGWIMVLLVYWSWINLSFSRRSCAWEGTTHGQIPWIHGNGRLEHKWISRSHRPKKYQIQCLVLSTEILEQIREWRETQGTGRIRKLWIRVGNTRPHTAKWSLEIVYVNRIQKAAHSLSSPDLAPTDFSDPGKWKENKPHLHSRILITFC